MKGFVSHLAARAMVAVATVVLAAGVTFTTPTQALANNWAAAAVAAAIVGIVAGGGRAAPPPKPTHTVIARYCKSHATGLYHRC